MKLIIEFSATELQKMLRAIAGSQGHEELEIGEDMAVIHATKIDGGKIMAYTLMSKVNP